MDLTEFLLARITEDEARYRELDEFEAKLNEPWRAFDPTVRDATQMFMTRAKPSHLLAECDAKRRIIRHAKSWLVNDHGRPHETALRIAGQETLLSLALPYADHPDYRDEWRP